MSNCLTKQKPKRETINRRPDPLRFEEQTSDKQGPLL